MDYKEFIKKYGKHKVRFGGYYKYKFMFSNQDGLIVYVGGNSDDIYKLDVEVDKEYTVEELEPDSAYQNGETIY